MQSWASHQPSESHLVANSELKSPPNDALVAGVVTMNAAMCIYPGKVEFLFPLLLCSLYENQANYGSMFAFVALSALYRLKAMKI